MKERVGAYIVKENGEIVPDLDDEAMAKRHGCWPKTEDAMKEGTEDAIGT